jgi:undecaprenyl-diphosphatase
MLLLLPLYGVARWRRFAVSLTAALVSTTALVFVLKQVVARHRPCNALSGVHALCVAPTDPSFPSGHACGSFTFAVFVLIVLHAGADRRVPPWARWVLSVAVVVAAVSIAWSRVYLGVHFPGDVAGGAVLGTMMGALWGLRYVRTRPH